MHRAPATGARSASRFPFPMSDDSALFDLLQQIRHALAHNDVDALPALLAQLDQLVPPAVAAPLLEQLLAEADPDPPLAPPMA